MHVLIVGGTRFVGYGLTWRLLAAGHRVSLLNRGTLPDPFGNRVERLRADRRTPEFARLLRGRTFDACVDTAVYSGDEARAAVAALRDAVGHYVAFSSGQVYLVRTEVSPPSREVDYAGPLLAEPTDPADRDEWAYGMGKRGLEDVLADAWATDRFPGTRLRLPMIHGERDYYRRLESYLWRLLDRGPIVLPDGGTRPMRHVSGHAVVRAIVAMLGNPATFGRAFNLAQPETPTLAELVTALADRLGTTAPLVAVPSATLRAAGLDPGSISPLSTRWMSFLDPTLARTELGFRHEPLDSMLEVIVRCFLDHPPAEPPASYAHRAAERTLAHAASTPPSDLPSWQP